VILTKANQSEDKAWDSVNRKLKKKPSGFRTEPGAGRFCDPIISQSGPKIKLGADHRDPKDIFAVEDTAWSGLFINLQKGRPEDKARSGSLS
jgi:hypothetical protein